MSNVHILAAMPSQAAALGAVRLPQTPVLSARALAILTLFR